MADVARGVEVEVAEEDREPGSEAPFLGGEQVETPFKRGTQGSLACGQVVWAAGEDR